MKIKNAAKLCDELIKVLPSAADEEFIYGLCDTEFLHLSPDWGDDFEIDEFAESLDYLKKSLAAHKELINKCEKLIAKYE